MALRDEINTARAQIQSDMYSDDEVYNKFVDKIYQCRIIAPIKEFLTSNASAKSFCQDVPFYSETIYVHSDEISRYRKESPIYDISHGEDHHCVKMKPLYQFERKGSFGKNKIIYITDLGKKVLKTLRAMAEKDGVIIEGPKAEYYCEYDAWGTTKRRYYYPNIGEWFAGKDPQNWHYSSSGYALLTIKFNL